MLSILGPRVLYLFWLCGALGAVVLPIFLRNRLSISRDWLCEFVLKVMWSLDNDMERVGVPPAVGGMALVF